MRMTSRIKIAACGAVAFAAVAAIPATSLAQSSGGGNATGCGSLEQGTPNFVPRIEYVENGLTKSVDFMHRPDLEEPAREHPHAVSYQTYRLDPTGEADLKVEAVTGNAAMEDCSETLYRLRVTNAQSQLITDVIVPGDADNSVIWQTTIPTPADGFVYVSVTAETAKGRVLDRMPDAVQGHQVNLGDSGATSAFK